MRRVARINRNIEDRFDSIVGENPLPGFPSVPASPEARLPSRGIQRRAIGREPECINRFAGQLSALNPLPAAVAGYPDTPIFRPHTEHLGPDRILRDNLDL